MTAKRRPTHPGEMLGEDVMPDYGLTVAGLAASVGVSRQSINELLRGRRAVRLPFAVLNAIVATQLEPFFSTIRPGIHTRGIEYTLLFIVVTLLPIGALIAIRPILRKSAGGARRFYVMNGLVAAVLVIAFCALVVGLGSEIYRCDVLQVPNCD